MASYYRRCSQCEKKVQTRDWWDHDYDVTNPFLCNECIDRKFFSHIQPERLNPKDADNSVCDSLNNANT